MIQGVQAQGVKALTAGAAASGASVAGQHVKLWCHEVGTATKSHYLEHLSFASSLVTSNSRDGDTFSMSQPRVWVEHHMPPPYRLASMCLRLLWLLQVLRVFYDRLVGESEQVWFLDSLKQVVARHFKTSFDTLFAHLTRAPGAAGTPAVCQHLMLGLLQRAPSWQPQCANVRMWRVRHSPFCNTPAIGDAGHLLGFASQCIVCAKPCHTIG